MRDVPVWDGFYVDSNNLPTDAGDPIPNNHMILSTAVHHVERARVTCQSISDTVIPSNRHD